jgi:hypothetical protein
MARRQQVQYQRSGTGFQTSAAPQRTTVRQSSAQATAATALAQSLGVASDNLEAYRLKEVAKKTALQEEKLDFYVSSVSNSIKEGDVTKAQIGELHPELVPSVMYKVQETVGKQKGRELLQPTIEQILANDNIRLDKNKLKATLDEAQNNILATTSEDNEFYIGGLATGMQSLIAQYEQNWSAERATFIKTKNTESFREDVGALIKEVRSGSNDTRSFEINAEALKSLDDTFGKWYGLNPVERKEAIYEEFAQKALEFGDTSILDSIPNWALNNEIKTNRDKLKNTITSNNISLYNFQNSQRELARKETIRTEKVSVLQQFNDAEGGLSGPKIIELSNYYAAQNLPELSEYVREFLNKTNVDEVTSKTTASNIRNRLSNGPSMSRATAQEVILDESNLTPADKAKLLEDMDSLLEDNYLINDKAVDDVYKEGVLGVIQTLRDRDAFPFTGEGVRAQSRASRKFKIRYRQSYREWVKQNNGQEPPASVKEALAYEASEYAVEELTPFLDIRNKGEVLKKSLEKPAPDLKEINKGLGSIDKPHTPTSREDYENIPINEYYIVPGSGEIVQKLK